MKLEVDLALARKYLRPGPRYTSYPTAPHFRDEFGPEDWTRAIEEGNRTADRPLSLYLHFPFCAKLCWFCGCTMLVSHDRSRSADYLDVLFREIDLVASRLHDDRLVVQQHFGGGTPTFSPPDELRSIGERLRKRFNYAPDAEIGVEMDPRELTLDHVRALREIGANRASLGVQDHDPVVQKAIHREQPREMVEQCIEWIRDEGFESLNLDLIYGLPHQSVRSFRETLDSVLEIRPDRLAIFNYAHVPWMKPHQKLIHENELPDEGERLAMLKDIIETVTAAGYVYVGMDHFALAEDELAVAQRAKTLQRNFQGYSTRAEAEIHAFGMSAISQLDGTYAQNAKDLATWSAKVDAGELPVLRGYSPTDEDRIRRALIMTLMCDLELDHERFRAATGVDPRERFADELASLEPMEEDRLVTRDDDAVRVTLPGRLFLRNIAMAFDAYLGEGGRFSKTV